MQLRRCASRRTIGPMRLSAPVPDEMSLGEAIKTAAHLFGGKDKVNIFRQHGLWHVGRFLDGGHYTDGPNRGRPMSPYHRQQEVFGVSASLREAFRFAIGVNRVYSGAGGPRGASDGMRGARPILDDKLRIVGWESAGGIFSKSFPSARIVTH